jgi:putative methyltransferase (TIGR04325 family)
MNLRRSIHILGSTRPLVYLTRFLYERQFRSEAGRGLFRGVYRDFDAAIASAPSGNPIGYDHSAAAQMYEARPVFPEDYAVLFWLRPLLAAGVRVLDFGGHAGGLFDAVRGLVDLPADIEWTIYDLPAVVEHGLARNSSRRDPLPRFTSSLESVMDADVMLASGSPQYCVAEFAGAVLSLREPPRHIILNQIPLHEGREFVTLQNIGTAFCPYWVRNREQFLKPLLAAGFDLVDMWTNPGKECRIPTYPRQTRPVYYGAYLRLRDSVTGSRQTTR